jgi:3-phenylpropionate/trans-cinnamate dioxygenase ferredoxin reductase subunit
MSTMAAAAQIGTVVVVGAGIAGASAVDILRREGFGGRIVLVGDEPEPPYERPPLSKEYLVGTRPLESVYLRTPDYYAEQGVELRLNTPAVGLDTAAQVVLLADGERVPYDRLLIATGGAARRVDVPGVDLDDVLYLRTLADARSLAARMDAAARSDRRVVVVGGGFIGAEVAAACRTLGLDVTLLELLAAPMERVLGAELGGILAQVHRTHGVDLRLGEGIAAFGGRSGGRVEEVITTRGTVIPCAFALVGVGMRPRVEWLVRSGVALDDGVLVDSLCASSVPGVFAAGDVARWPYAQPGMAYPEHVRLEHWDNGLRQGEAAARNLLGNAIPFAPVPYFWSDQYDLKLQYVGYAKTWEHVVMRGDPASSSFAAFYLADGRLRAALAVNRVRDLVPLKKLIGAQLETEALADEAVDLRALAASTRRG